MICPNQLYRNDNEYYIDIHLFNFFYKRNILFKNLMKTNPENMFLQWKSRLEFFVYEQFANLR